jgi:hypothetical protein
VGEALLQLPKIRDLFNVYNRARSKGLITKGTLPAQRAGLLRLGPGPFYGATKAVAAITPAYEALIDSSIRQVQEEIRDARKRKRLNSLVFSATGAACVVAKISSVAAECGLTGTGTGSR